MAKNKQTNKLTTFFLLQDFEGLRGNKMVRNAAQGSGGLH